MRKTNNKIFSLWLKRLKFNFRAICVFVYMGSDFLCRCCVDIVAGKNKFLIFMETLPHLNEKHTHENCKTKKERKKMENYVYLNDFYLPFNI